MTNGYLNNVYLYEDLKLINEDFASLFRSKAFDLIKTKFASAVKRKDGQSLKAIASKIPSIPVKSLRQIGKKAHPKFEKTYLFTLAKMKNQKKITNQKMKELIAISIASIATVATDPNKKADELLKKLHKLIASNDIKEEAAFFGFSMILAGSLVAGAYATLALWPLLLALFIVALTMMAAIQ